MIHQSIYAPTLTCDHELWDMNEVPEMQGGETNFLQRHLKMPRNILERLHVSAGLVSKH